MSSICPGCLKVNSRADALKRNQMFSYKKIKHLSSNATGFDKLVSPLKLSENPTVTENNNNNSNNELANNSPVYAKLREVLKRKCSFLSKNSECNEGFDSFHISKRMKKKDHYEINVNKVDDMEEKVEDDKEEEGMVKDNFEEEQENFDINELVGSLRFYINSIILYKVLSVNQ